MQLPIITLTTDFGEGSAYVAAMKGVILGSNPAVRIIDLGHCLPPQDLQAASFYLAGTVPYYPAGTIHVAVIDPGVGSTRRLLCLEAGGQRLLLPDNGIATGVLARLGPARGHALANAAYWRPAVSHTFHGRDILAPTAAHLSLGVDPADLGPEVNDWLTLPMPRATLELDGQRAFGVVVHVDAFGNLITNLEADLVAAVGPCRVRIAGHSMAGLVKTYADATPGSLVALISSFGTLEVAVVNGSATERLGTAAGAAVVVERLPSA